MQKLPNFLTHAKDRHAEQQNICLRYTKCSQI